MNKVMKFIVVPIVSLIAVFLFVVNFSATETSYRCVGDIVSGGESKPETVFIKLTEYRSWVGLWSDSDGSLNLEVPNEWVDSYGYLKEVSDQYQIYEGYSEPSLAGNFSKLSKTLALQMPGGFFDGTCSKN